MMKLNSVELSGSGCWAVLNESYINWRVHAELTYPISDIVTDLRVVIILGVGSGYPEDLYDENVGQ
jgi:hypothetical protein